MNEEFKNRRKDYFIKKDFQRKFIIKFCALALIGSVLSSLLIYIMTTSTVTTTFEHCKLVIKNTADSILPAVVLSGAITIVIVVIAVIIVTLFTSHRIAGPLYRMEKDVGEVASGNLKVAFRLRSTDEIKALAAGLDIMVHNINDVVTSAKKSVSELESAIDSSDTSKAKAALTRVKSELNKFKT